MEKAQKACQPILRNAIGEPSPRSARRWSTPCSSSPAACASTSVQIADPKPGEGIRVGGPGTKIDPEESHLQEGAEGLRELVRKGVEGTDGGEDDQ